MPPSLPAPTLSDQSGLWACGQREDALPTGPTGATTGDYMIEKCQPCNRSTLSAMYPVEPESDLSPHAGRGGVRCTSECSRTASWDFAGKTFRHRIRMTSRARTREQTTAQGGDHAGDSFGPH